MPDKISVRRFRYRPAKYATPASVAASASGRTDPHSDHETNVCEGKNHELWEELRRGHLLHAGWLFVLWVMIGYGYRVWHALVWIAVLVTVGWLIARKSGRKVPGSGEPLGFWYSVDRLLPIVELRKRHYEVDLPRRSRVYFYFHTVMGYVLATFLLAGLSGLVG